MTEEQISQREAELRSKHPEIFSHPECRDGEILLEESVVDFAVFNVNIYRSIGLPSARLGKGKLKEFRGLVDGKPVTGKFAHHGIFVNLRELILAEEAKKQKKASV